MPPKKTAASARGRPSGASSASASTSARARAGQPPKTNASAGRSRNDSASEVEMLDSDDAVEDTAVEDVAEEEEAQRTIPPELLTRLLHELFKDESTRISKDANAAVAKYMEIFVREAIARTAAERRDGFLEVEDLEKIAPQLLLDF